MSLRNGFTVVESLVALTLIGVGVAAWMATATLGVAVAADAARATNAAHRARNRAVQVASLPCTGVVSGSSASENWTVREYANGMRLVEAESKYRTRTRSDAAHYAILVAC